MTSLPTPVHVGLLTLRAVSDGGGALDAGFKALATATAAAAQRDGALAGRELARAVSLGVEPARAWAAAGVLLSSRGEGAYELLADAARACFGDPPDVDRPTTPLPPDALARAQAFVSGGTGELPPFAAPLAAHAPQALVGYAGMLEAAGSQPALSPREVQLLLVCVNVAGLHPDFAAHHARLARAAGATDAQVVEAGVCAIPSGGVTAWYAAGARLLDT